MRIILASASPRRRELMKNITEDFEVIVSDADESAVKSDDILKTAQILAQIKAKSVAEKNTDALVIGADTVVRLNDKILGKPKSKEEAFKMLRMLSGNSHFVDTGVCIVFEGKAESFTVTTKVEFNKISYGEMMSYIESGEPFDKAGGYGIQGKASIFVKGICGDYFNVVGLPVSALYQRIKGIINS